MQEFLQLLNMRGPRYPSVDKQGQMNWAPLDYLQERLYHDLINERPPIETQFETQNPKPPKLPTPAEIEKAREQDLQSSAQRNRQLLVAIRKYRRAS